LNLNTKLKMIDFGRILGNFLVLGIIGGILWTIYAKMKEGKTKNALRKFKEWVLKDDE